MFKADLAAPKDFQMTKEASVVPTWKRLVIKNAGVICVINVLLYAL